MYADQALLPLLYFIIIFFFAANVDLFLSPPPLVENADSPFKAPKASAVTRVVVVGNTTGDSYLALLEEQSCKDIWTLGSRGTVCIRTHVHCTFGLYIREVCMHAGT